MRIKELDLKTCSKSISQLALSWYTSRTLQPTQGEFGIGIGINNIRNRPFTEIKLNYLG